MSLRNLLLLRDAVEQFPQLTRTTLRNWISRGLGGRRLPATRIGHQYLVDPKHVETFIAQIDSSVDRAALQRINDLSDVAVRLFAELFFVSSGSPYVEPAHYDAVRRTYLSRGAVESYDDALCELQCRMLLLRTSFGDQLQLPSIDRGPGNCGTRAQSKTQKLAKQLAARDGWRCQYCANRKRLTWRTAVVEHMIPQSRGGGNALDNLVLACTRCNIKKGPRMPLEHFFACKVTLPSRRGSMVEDRVRVGPSPWRLGT